MFLRLLFNFYKYFSTFWFKLHFTCIHNRYSRSTYFLQESQNLNLLQGFQTHQSRNRIHDCNDSLQQSLLYKGILTQYYSQKKSYKLYQFFLLHIILFHKFWITFRIRSDFVLRAQEWKASWIQSCILKTCWCEETKHSSNEGSSAVNNDMIIRCTALPLLSAKQNCRSWCC